MFELVNSNSDIISLKLGNLMKKDKKDGGFDITGYTDCYKVKKEIDENGFIYYNVGIDGIKEFNIETIDKETNETCNIIVHLSGRSSTAGSLSLLEPSLFNLCLAQEENYIPTLNLSEKDTTQTCKFYPMLSSDNPPKPPFTKIEHGTYDYVMNSKRMKIDQETYSTFMQVSFFKNEREYGINIVVPSNPKKAVKDAYVIHCDDNENENEYKIISDFINDDHLWNELLKAYTNSIEKYYLDMAGEIDDIPMEIRIDCIKTLFCKEILKLCSEINNHIAIKLFSALFNSYIGLRDPRSYSRLLKAEYEFENDFDLQKVMINPGEAFEVEKSEIDKKIPYGIGYAGIIRRKKNDLKNERDINNWKKIIHHGGLFDCTYGNSPYYMFACADDKDRKPDEKVWIPPAGLVMGVLDVYKVMNPIFDSKNPQKIIGFKDAREELRANYQNVKTYDEMKKKIGFGSTGIENACL